MKKNILLGKFNNFGLRQVNFFLILNEKHGGIYHFLRGTFK